MNDAQIKHMGEQFLRWQLPENFNPDGGISFEPIGNKGNSTYEFKRRPSGTNLLDYTQAEAMVRHMLDGLPAKAETTMTSNLDPAALEALVREAIEPLNDTLSSSDYSFLFDNVKDAIVKGLDTLSHAGEGEPVAWRYRLPDTTQWLMVNGRDWPENWGTDVFERQPLYALARPVDKAAGAPE